MRLHRLTLAAFGPFATVQHIDFDRLAAGGLFLLHGPTGAGKTAVLDAVCYALYGSVPGVRQQQLTALRSHHAGPADPTEVILELTVEGRRLEVTRRPEQPRPKKRGTGYTQEKAQTLLRERTADGNWRPLSRSHQETGEELGRLIGMNRDQFCQVVLLPQGDFARFLRAGAEDRARLLGRLFDTGRFGAVEQHLARLRTDALHRVQAGDQRILALLHRIQQAAGPGHPPPAEHSPGDEELARTAMDFAAWARCAARAEAEYAGLTAELAEEAHRQAGARLAETTERARLQERHRQAADHAAELAAGAEQAAADRERLDRARAAASVAPALELRGDAEEAARAARATEQAARAALPPRLAEADTGHLTTEEHSARAQLGGLAAALRAEQRARDLTAELDRLQRQDTEDRQRLRGTEARHRDAEEGLAALRQRVASAEAAAGEAPALAARLAEAERRLTAARRAAELAEEADALDGTLLAAREHAATAREHWLDLRQRRLTGIAAELAATLSDGAPCAVCGSAEHPRPARPGAGQVDHAAESAALAAHQEAETARGDAERRLAAARAEQSAQHEQSGGRSAAELTAEADRLRAARTEADAATGEASRAAAGLAEAEAAHRGLVEERQALREGAAARNSRVAALEAERRALLAEAEPHGTGARPPGPPTGAPPTGVAARAAALEELAGLLAAAAQAAHAAGRAADQLKDADARAADAAFRAGFTTPDEAAAAQLAPGTQDTLRQRLEERRAAETAVSAVLTELRTAEAAAEPPADPDAAAAAAAAATARLRESGARQAAATARRDELEELSGALTAAVRRQAPERDAASRVSGLAQLTAGTAAGNSYRMRLETYVLTARLEQIAAAADARLHRMSAGRYVLTHSDSRTGRGRSGLGLRVLDSWTGRDRDTATLSGGESFFVSLALALGLADVVAEESGGRRLDTLFIDEGFGSLDEQSLDEVLEVLDTLREQERSVGIVSHVPELRARVPVRLEVLKTRDGSAVRHHAAPLAR